METRSGDCRFSARLNPPQLASGHKHFYLVFFILAICK
ncbi:Uncharacterized protein ChrSV_3141 [Chromobacterium vaccinii]|nr:Uncharacterized protein ChrSW_3141 [Chromobacterium vaccinii]QND90598.1 Uncharacterized protein ChrSV_3141 [Chromobacterium vaccinii]